MAGWDIPAEPLVVSAVERHFGRKGLVRLEPSTAGPAAILLLESNGACTFFDTAGHLCSIHRDLGEGFLPSACRQFPRVTLSDPSGTWITLSHFCPTAASLLFFPAPIVIVAAPATISLDGHAHGLDATEALPPLLRPGMLMDFDGYHAWESAAVSLLDSAAPDVNGALSALESASRDIREWCPGQRTLREAVLEAMRSASSVASTGDPGDDRQAYSLALASVPSTLRPPSKDEGIGSRHADVDFLWREFDDVIRRYLASKLFAGWWPYLGLDLRSVVYAIRVHAAVLRTNLSRQLRRRDSGRDAMREAIRDTDLLMVHLSDARALARLIAKQS
jgi:hypothetical protein